jgi:uncharacterized protein (DUF58 family)
MVREFEEETALDARLVLVGTGAREAARRERALSEAASLARALLRAGSAVALSGPGLELPAGRGLEHERRVLGALALYDPAAAALPVLPTASGLRARAGEREIRFHLGW